MIRVANRSALLHANTLNVNVYGGYRESGKFADAVGNIFNDVLGDRVQRNAVFDDHLHVYHSRIPVYAYGNALSDVFAS